MPLTKRALIDFRNMDPGERRKLYAHPEHGSALRDFDNMDPAEQDKLLHGVAETSGEGPRPPVMPPDGSIVSDTLGFPGAQPDMLGRSAMPMLGMGIGGTMAGIPGAAAGGGIGGAVNVLGDVLFGEQMPSVGEAVQEPIQETLVGGASELAPFLGGKLLGPAAKSFYRGGRRALRAAMDIGVERVTAGQLSQSSIFKWLDDMAASSMTAAGHFSRKLSEKLGKIDILIESYIDDMGRLGLSKREIGEELTQMIRSGDKMWRTDGAAKYADVDALAQGAMVDIRGIKEFARKELEIAERVPGSSASLISEMKKILALEDEESFFVVAKMRSNIGGLRRTADDPATNTYLGAMKQVYGLADSAINEASDLTPAAKAAWEKANAFWKEGAEKYNNKLIKSIMSRKDIDLDPEWVVDTFIGGKSGFRAETIAKAIGEEGLAKVRSAYLDTIYRGSLVDVDGVLHFNAKRMLSQIGKAPSKFEAIMGETAANDARGLLSALDMIQTKEKTGGGMVIQLTQWGAIAALGGAVATDRKSDPKFLAPGVMALTVPYMWSLITHNPNAVRYLTKGLVAQGTREGTKAAIRAFTDLTIGLQRKRREEAGITAGYGETPQEMGAEYAEPTRGRSPSLLGRGSKVHTFLEGIFPKGRNK